MVPKAPRISGCTNVRRENTHLSQNVCAVRPIPPHDVPLARAILPPDRRYRRAMTLEFRLTNREVGQWRAVRTVEGGREGRNSSPARRGTRQLLLIRSEKVR
jgi:hypothetical protein